MESNLINIALITNDEKRLEYIGENLKQAHTSINDFAFEDIYAAQLGNDPYDLIIIDSFKSLDPTAPSAEFFSNDKRIFLNSSG